MSRFKALSATLTLVVLTVAAFAIPPAKMSVSSQSKIWVDGTSTLHNFTCTASKFTGSFDASEKGAKALNRVEITVPTKNLGCGHGQMDSKMYEALKVDKFASIKYVSTNISATEIGGGKYRLNTQGKLTLAGVEKPISMVVEAQELGNGQLRVTGSTPIVMSEFGVKRPSAAMGTIKTGDKVTVRFDVTTVGQ